MLHIYLILLYHLSLYTTEKASVLNENTGFAIREISSNSNTETLSSNNFDNCRAVFKDYDYKNLNDETYLKEKSPVQTWICVYSGEAFEAGYDAAITDNNGNEISRADNKIIYDYNNKTWLSVSDDRYEKSLPSNHLILHTIISTNSTGFMVIDQQATLENGNIGKKMFFCMIHKNHALCGTGDMIKNVNGQEYDLTSKTINLVKSITFVDN